MKKSELRALVQEQVRKVLKEDILNAPGQDQWDTKFHILYDELPANLDLKTASLNKLFQGIPYQHVAWPEFSDDGAFLFKTAQDLAKAKQALGMNESVVTEANELSSYKIGDEVKFSNGEVWKVAKPGVKGDKIFLAPFNSIAKKGHISLAIEFTQDELKDTVTESINEAANDISYINKARAKSSLEQIKKGKRSDGMGKFDAKVFAIKGTQEIELKDPADLAKYSVGYKYGLKNESILKEFGPMAGSGNVRANDLDNLKRDAAKKSERGDTVYIVGGKNGSYKLSKYFEKGNTYAAFYNGMPQIVEGITEASITEDAGMVVDVAMGVAAGLMGLWALVQSAPLVGRVFGDAAEYLANKSEKKAKMALKNQRKETIAPIIAKFKNDTRLADMYQNLTPYTQGLSRNQILDNKDRRRQLITIGNYIKAKLTPEEMQYFTDVSAMLRDGDLK